jgi:hypothetical protein
MIEDQRFAWMRPDVLSYATPNLTLDTTLAGPIKVTLYVSSTGTDSDFIVKLIDVFPNDYSVASPRDNTYPMGGYQMMVRGEPMRAKYRNSWSKPTPLTPGKIEKLEFNMPDVFFTFRKGHKIMVQVQSSWFPVVDRNPQKFVNIMTAKESDFQKATERIYLSGATASKITVGVMPPEKLKLISEVLKDIFSHTDPELRFALSDVKDILVTPYHWNDYLPFETNLQRFCKALDLTYSRAALTYTILKRQTGPIDSANKSLNP